jgi:hypothetical protein
MDCAPRGSGRGRGRGNGSGSGSEKITVAPLRQQVQRLHWRIDRKLVAVMDDPSTDWPHAAALYLHAVHVEDGLITTLLKDTPPLFAAESSWIFSPPAWRDHRSAVRRYVHATRVMTDVYLANVTPDDLDRSVLLPAESAPELVTAGWILSELFVPFLANVPAALDGR